MTLRAVIVITAILVSIGPASADEAASEPAVSQPASTQPASLDPAVAEILDRLERQGNTIEDIAATIQFIKVDTILEDKQKYEGTLRFKQDEPNPRFLVRFDRRVHEGIVSDEKEWHGFDGRWYTEARESTKQIIRREILRPDEKRDIFRLGEGPFPLPFGQRKADILRLFSVTLVPPAENDPPGTRHLACTPRPETEMADKYDTVHFYIDLQRDLPVRVRTVDKEEHTEIIVSFPEIKVNTGLAGSALNLPDLPDYHTTEERLDVGGPRGSE